MFVGTSTAWKRLTSAADVWMPMFERYRTACSNISTNVIGTFIFLGDLRLLKFECRWLNVQTSTFKHWQLIFEPALPTNMEDYMLPNCSLKKSGQIPNKLGPKFNISEKCFPPSKLFLPYPHFWIKSNRKVFFEFR